MGATNRYPCPGVGCGNAVATPAHWDEDAQRWVGRTCGTCEKQRRTELSESELAVYARDPYLSASALRLLYNRQSPLINAALASRGVPHLQASLAAELGVDEATPVQPLVPFWAQYRQDPPTAPIGGTAAPTAGPAAVAAVLSGAGERGRESALGSPPPRRRGLLIAAWAAAVVVMLAAAAFLYLRDEDGDVASAPTTTQASAITDATTDAASATTAATGEQERTTSPPTTAPRATTPASTAPPTTTTTTTVATTSRTRSAAPATSTTVATTTIPATTAAATTTTIPTIQYVRGTLPLRWAEYADGIVYLRGRVPNQQTADEITEIAAGVVGPENVRVEYTIDPKAPLVDGAPLYVRDAVPFDPAESAPGLEAYPVLDLGVVLLEQNPQMIVEIGGHTDDRGSAAYNLELSRQRASVVRDYLIERGVNPAQVVVRAYGESQPIVGNDTPEGRDANRRIELSVFGLLS